MCSFGPYQLKHIPNLLFLRRESFSFAQNYINGTHKFSRKSDFLFILLQHTFVNYSTQQGLYNSQHIQQITLSNKQPILFKTVLSTKYSYNHISSYRNISIHFLNAIRNINITLIKLVKFDALICKGFHTS